MNPETPPENDKALVRGELQPPMAVAIPDPGREAVIAQSEEAMLEMGFTKMGAGSLKNLAKIGMAIHGAGVVVVQHGGAYLSQARLELSMAALQTRIDHIANKKQKSKKDTELLLQLVREQGRLSSHLSKSHKVVLESSGAAQGGGGNPSPPPVVTRTPFRAGAQVQPAGAQVVVQSGGTVNLNPPADKKE